MSKTRIVVVGAGYAGVFGTKHLSKKLKKHEDVEITLIDRHTYQTMMTELHEVAGGRVEPEAIQYDLQRLFSRRKNVKLVTDNVTNIDKDNKVVITEHGEYPFDYLMLGMGGEPNDFGTPGVKEHGFTLWSMEDAIRLRHHIENTVAKAAVEPDEQVRRSMLTFVVCGSGFTGIEMVGELIDMREPIAKKHKISPDEITLKVVEAAPTILNMLDRNDAAIAERFLNKKEVEIIKSSPIVEVGATDITLKDGSKIPTHTLIWTAGVQGNSDAKEFDMETGRANRLVANEYLQAKGYEDKGIYVVGDLVYYEEFENTPTPQIVQAAEGTGQYAATNIVAEINGTEKKAYKGNYQGFMVSIGSKYGVACLFEKIHLSGFLAIIMKHIVNLKYFFDIRSGYYMFQYMMHEFFRVENERNVTRGHSSRNSNVLWSVPLRVFYGLVWLVEAMKKVVGNGDYLKPATWFKEGSWFTDQVAFPFPWLQAADATSGASEAASGGAETVAHFGLSYAYGEEPMLVFDHMPKWFASLMEFMVPNREVALFFQKFMTIFEILIALAIIVGLFTWLANATTIALVAAFCLSGMFYWVNIWFIPVAFALMNGSGRALGLDKWVVPWLQRTLGKWWYGETKSLYGH
ncbi:NAD(P)/FAD-dependent oxidoreductase [Vagococcus lutrae]|uniref:NAD(P)/FAD-dependent oxidoreductase n=1 Tax=Vagococcus lutrae TaxID=81947 RepID=UPI002097F4EC|nr:NAD(P)/FAD-dependent oxidoreductase [Vagococcus lutrae]MCO7150451.1 NAD(P)/FAD-dependent oxidoreductase [Vagococcus lutrae]MDT2811691.1 NAD(P)/FAD-dependent oxidoreductase [Vagococcus lutrae]MDT2818851.1 NAD(P)/FAD-dependent oxidoreductase [Vagococcus lutrae]MDT2843582.1 NAD(P)/FAD-dependent oxidoreductase [Vagococcus lutrae]WCG04467.1 NAD(P)/FAD-dependent oxidoreductase [Vagococcus lutrae]